MLIFYHFFTFFASDFFDFAKNDAVNEKRFAIIKIVFCILLLLLIGVIFIRTPKKFIKTSADGKIGKIMYYSNAYYLIFSCRKPKSVENIEFSPTCGKVC